MFRKTERITFKVTPKKKIFVDKVCDAAQVPAATKARELFLNWIDQEAQRLGMEEKP